MKGWLWILPSITHPNFIYKFSHSPKSIFDLSTINPTKFLLYGSRHKALQFGDPFKLPLLLLLGTLSFYFYVTYIFHARSQGSAVGAEALNKRSTILKERSTVLLLKVPTLNDVHTMFTLLDLHGVTKPQTG